MGKIRKYDKGQEKMMLNQKRQKKKQERKTVLLRNREDKHR